MTWLDIIPAIPLARGVPVRADFSGTAVVTSVTMDGVVLADRYAVDSEPHTAYAWRVDLDDPQGFAYALGWVSRNIPRSFNYSAHPILKGHAVWDRWGEEGTTDADRLALAKALREVTR